MEIMTQLPKKISPCPIKESVFEIRFDSDFPEDAIFGVLYEKFKEQYANVEQLPILQLPQVVRSQDPNLIYAPHYKLTHENTTIQIGPKVFSLARAGEYIGWDVFYDEIIDIYNKVEETNIISKLQRVALRYINIFENMNILDHAAFKAYLGSNILNGEKINFSAEIPSEKSVLQLKIINAAEFIISNNAIRGSIIDIDSPVNRDDFDSFSDAIKYSHEQEKILFYKVLGEDFIKTLNPEY